MSYAASLRYLALATFVFALTATVTSCAVTQEPLVAQGLLTGEPCEPPCWRGLVPGLSTQREVIDVLESSRCADSLEVGPGRYEAITIITWQPYRIGWSSQQRNMFELQDGQLEVMSMYVDSDVTLEEVANRYGAPDKFSAGLKMSGRIYTLVELFYRQRGMILQLHLYDVVPELKPETKVARVWYFEPAPLDEAMATIEGKKGEPLEDFQLEWLDYWHDWEGYGVVETDHGYP